MDRLNFAYQLTNNKFANQKFDCAEAAGVEADVRIATATWRSCRVGTAKARAMDVSTASATPAPAFGPDVALHVLEGSLIGGEISPGTSTFIHTQMAQQPASNPTDTLNLLTALLLGSPEFQLH